MKSKLLSLVAIIISLLFVEIKSDTDDWLHVNDKNEIVDAKGNPVWMTGVNWFGFNTGTGIFDGLWSANFRKVITGIADRGFNLIRIPVSTEILLQWKGGQKVRANINVYANPEVEEELGDESTSSFALFGLTIKWCKELGIKIMIDVHSASTDASGHVYNLWYNDEFSTNDWIEALSWFADYYKEDDTILAIDIKNEPHGKGDDIQKGNGAKWDDSKDPNNWKYAVETCATKILDKNPNLLIMVEGIEVYPKEEFDWTAPTHDYTNNFDPYYPGWWGGNLRGVKDFPINLGKYQKQLVYSPHDYGPLVYAQPWFHSGFDEDSIMEEYWRDSWFFILEEKITPLLIGEWGGFLDGGNNQKWMEILRDLMIKNKIHHTFWCINENSGDTGGLLAGSNWDEAKYKLLKPALWQKDGKFISLDHKVKLGSNGLSISDVY